MLLLKYIRSSKRQNKMPYANSYFHMLIKRSRHNYFLSQFQPQFPLWIRGLWTRWSLNNCTFMLNTFNCFLFLNCFLFHVLNILFFLFLILYTQIHTHTRTQRQAQTLPCVCLFLLVAYFLQHLSLWLSFLFIPNVHGFFFS